MGNLKKQETWYGFRVSLNDFLNSSQETRDDFILKEAVYQSNLIEGITKDWCETVPVDNKENPIISLSQELSDHYKSYDYVLENMTRTPKEQDILYLHDLLMKNIFLERAKEIINLNKLDGEKAEKITKFFENRSGKYRKCKVWVGPHDGIMKGCLHHRQIPRAMKQLWKEIKSLDLEEEIDEKEYIIWSIHHEFETIHPFVDGNGRTGRLLLNWLSLNHLKEFSIVQSSKKMKYYDRINSYSEQYRKSNPNLHFYKDIPKKPEKREDAVIKMASALFNFRKEER